MNPEFPGHPHPRSFPDPPDTLADPQYHSPWQSLVESFLATSLYRCWFILLCLAGWSTVISCINGLTTHQLVFQPTLLTVLGTVLGFVISYRTTASFERYNEGRRYWSQIILASRTFARTVWFHVPDSAPDNSQEKRTVIILIDAFGICAKHYLRRDVKFEPGDLHALMNNLTSQGLHSGPPSKDGDRDSEHRPSTSQTIHPQSLEGSSVGTRRTFNSLANVKESDSGGPSQSKTYHTSSGDKAEGAHAKAVPPKSSTLPPETASYSSRFFSSRFFLSLFPVQRHPEHIDAYNIPLEISLHLSSYVSALQARKAVDSPTVSILLATLNQLVDALAGLERILTTPIPHSYYVHLWTVTVVYCLTLPFQLWNPLGWVTIPGTTVVSFIFFGFLVAGEEIENPFGHDKNDLDMDEFGDIIHAELTALVASPESFRFVVEEPYEAPPVPDDGTKQVDARNVEELKAADSKSS